MTSVKGAARELVDAVLAGDFRVAERAYRSIPRREQVRARGWQRRSGIEFRWKPTLRERALTGLAELTGPWVVTLDGVVLLVGFDDETPDLDAAQREALELCGLL